MPYASVQSMVDRFGETEMLRLSQPEDRTAETIVAAKVELSIADASAVIDDYLRGRYAVPLASPPDSIVRAACVLARYDLAKGDVTEPTEQMRLDRKDVLAFLAALAAGDISIDAPAATGPTNGGNGGGARISDRDRAFSNDSLRNW